MASVKTNGLSRGRDVLAQQVTACRVSFNRFADTSVVQFSSLANCVTDSHPLFLLPVLLCLLNSACVWVFTIETCLLWLSSKWWTPNSGGGGEDSNVGLYRATMSSCQRVWCDVFDYQL